MTVREMLSRMDSHEFAEWMAFTTLEPLPEDRADIRAAMIAHTMACMWTSGEKPKFENFLIVKPPKTTQTIAEQMGMAGMVNSAMSSLPSAEE